MSEQTGDQAEGDIQTGDIKGETVITGHKPQVTINKPLRPGITALNQLPPPLDDFTGRKAELDQLRKAIGEGGVTISGVRGLGGIGKTALATVLANELKAAYPDAQFFVNLRGASGDPLAPAEALTHVIRGYHPTAQLPAEVDQLRAAYLGLLQNQRALILLDDARDAVQIKPLIPPKTCLLLVTTRQKFALPGLRTLDLSKLPEPDAITLLRTIAPRIDDKAAAKIANLCGHLPLALRLAASLLKEYDDTPLDRYITRLGDESKRLAALDKAEQLAGLPYGVQASLELSLNLLDDTICQRWAELSTFPADFDFPAVQAIWDADEETAEGSLNELRRHSLIDWNPKTERYRLHDLARLAARARLSEAQRHAAGLRHAAYYKDLLRSAKELYKRGNEHILEGLARYDLEQANIHAGQQWAAGRAAGDETAAGLAEDYPDAGAYVLDLRLHPRQYITWLEAALAAARRLGRKQAEGVHLGNLGEKYYRLGQIPRAIEYHQQALVISREIGDQRGEGSALGNLGNAHYSLGQIPRAIEFYQQQLDITRQIGDRRGEANALMNTGNAHYSLGEMQQAIEHHEQALPIFRQIGDRRGEGSALGNLGNAHYSLGQIPRAIEFYQQQLDITRQIGDRRGEGSALGNLGTAYHRLGEIPRAIEYHQQALEVMQAIGDKRAQGQILGNLGLAYADLGEIPRAIEYYQQQLEITRQIGDRRGEGAALGNLGNAYASLGEIPRAIEFYEQRLEIARQIGDRRGEGNALGNLGIAYKNLGELPRAIECYQQQLEIARQIGDRQGEGNACWNLGLLHEQQGDLPRAIKLMQVLVDFERQLGHPDAEPRAARVDEIRARLAASWGKKKWWQFWK